MDFGLYLGFVAAVGVLVLVPGPLVALIVSNSVAYGTRFGLMTVLGAAAATMVHLLVVAAGMTAAVIEIGPWFHLVRIAGGAYVVWIGVQAWRGAAADLTRTMAQPRNARAILLNGFVVALFNPKALLFYAAFFPQFVSPSFPVAPQVTLLCVTLLFLGMTCDTGWAMLAGRGRHVLALHGRLRNRVTGGMLVTAGVVLTMVHGT